MRFLQYIYPEIEIDVYPHGELMMTVSDKKETVILVSLGSRHQKLLAEAITAAQARTYPNPIGEGILTFPPKEDKPALDKPADQQ